MQLLPGIRFYANALADADAVFAALRVELTPHLRQEHLTFSGREVPMPRLTAWFGDAGTTYTYSGLVNKPTSWTPALAALRQRLDARLCVTLNSCLANLYRGGRDSIGWHADDEPELRDTIVSVSFGDAREFSLRNNKTREITTVVLPHGSVLTMTVESQRYFQHALLKTSGGTERLNLTFRTVHVAESCAQSDR